MNWKDNFSSQAKTYAQYRPTYPPELYESFLPYVKNKSLAWDCACGNGQVAQVLVDSFDQVIATDASQAQIEQAPIHPNISYRMTPAEHSGLEDHSVDLITVAQAMHWFQFEDFYKETKRVASKEAVIAIWGYGLLKINPEIDAIIQKLYANILGNYWDIERKHIDEAYQSIPFPFDEILLPKFQIIREWDLEMLLGYFNSWSSTQHYLRKNKQNPIEFIQDELLKKWNNPHHSLTITWDLFLKVAFIK